MTSRQSTHSTSPPKASAATPRCGLAAHAAARGASPVQTCEGADRVVGRAESAEHGEPQHRTHANTAQHGIATRNATNLGVLRLQLPNRAGAGFATGHGGSPRWHHEAHAEAPRVPPWFVDSNTHLPRAGRDAGDTTGQLAMSGDAEKLGRGGGWQQRVSGRQRSKASPVRCRDRCDVHRPQSCARTIRHHCPCAQGAARCQDTTDVAVGQAPPCASRHPCAGVSLPRCQTRARRRV